VEKPVQSFNQEQNHEDHVPADHPLRRIKSLANCALKELSKDFRKMYSPTGWPSVPPGKLIRAILLQVLYSIRSEGLLLEQLDYNLLFRWFVGLAVDEEVWDQSTFSESRKRLLAADIAGKFFYMIREQAREQGLLSDEHFNVDTTLIDALASQKNWAGEERDANGVGDS
jgi:transposase